jgi:TetR/AcrR family transcriptional regulator
VKAASTPRREREKSVRSEILLDAAEAAFVARGYAGASMEDIAAGGEVSLATLYKSFPSKESLFAEVVGRRMVAFVEFARETTGDQVGAESLEQLVESAFRYFEKYDGAFRLYLSATGGFSWEFRANLREGAADRYGEFLRYIESLVQAASPARSRKEARHIALSLTGALNAILGDWVQQPNRRPARSVAKDAWSVLRRLLDHP